MKISPSFTMKMLEPNPSQRLPLVSSRIAHADGSTRGDFLVGDDQVQIIMRFARGVSDSPEGCADATAPSP